MASSPSLSREGHGIARDAMALFAVKNGYATETATGTVTLDDTYPSIIGIDPGGAGRDVTLDAEATSDGLTRVIVNRADAAEDLTVKDDGGGTIGTISQNEAALFHCNGTAWSLVFIITGALS